MKSNLPNMLKQVRKEKDITQTEIAEVLGISQKVYSTYEVGTREPNIDILIKMADYFGVSIDFLVGRYKLREESK